MDASSQLILVCDHRGAGLSERLEPLGAAGLFLEVSRNPRTTLAALAERRPAVVVIDPLSAQGRAELEAIHERCTGEPPLPVLLVADRADPLPTILASRLFDRGEWDIVYRDAPVEEYLRRMDKLRAQARRLSEMDDLRYRAAHDDRTDLLRPSAFQARLVEHFSAAQRHGFDLALALCDLDAFGRINKVHDHTIGDRVIEAVGGAIRETLRAEDVAGRLGGDEFGVVLPYTSRLDAARVVHRIRTSVHELTGHVESVPPEVRVSASIGFETFDGRDLEGTDELRSHAETAMRSAKRGGGNVAVYYRSLVVRDAPLD